MCCASGQAACVLCQRQDFIEHRHKLNLFGQPPSNHQASSCSIGGAPQPAEPSSRAPEDTDEEGHALEQDTRQQFLLMHGGVHYLQSLEAVHAFLSVEQYATRWPLISADELHASSVQHPLHPEWRWLLHGKRVLVKPDARGSTRTHRCVPSWTRTSRRTPGCPAALLSLLNGSGSPCFCRSASTRGPTRLPSCCQWPRQPTTTAPSGSEVAASERPARSTWSCSLWPDPA